MNAGQNPSRQSAGTAARGLAVAAALLVAVGCTSLSEHMAMKDAANAYKAGNFQIAADNWKRALDLNPNRAENWKRLAFCYWSLIEPGSKQPKDQELTQKALDAFQRYMQIVGKDDAIQDYIINLYINQYRLNDGIKYYEGLLKENPSDARILYTLSVMYGKTGNFEKALYYSEKKAALSQNDAAGYLFLGALCWERSNSKQDPPEYRAKLVDKGFASLDKALAIDPMSFESHVYKNLLYRQRQDLCKLAAEDERDRRRKKDLLDQADDFLKKANEERDKALEIRKAKQAGPAAAPAAPASN